MITNTQEGGTHGVNIGSLKRRLKRIALARLTSTETPTAPATQNLRLLLKNLNGVLNVQVAVGVESVDNFMIRPNLYPPPGTAFGTVQLTPINNFPDAARKVYLRPVFQNPALPQNQNNPLPQDLPFGWEFDTRADEVEIDVFLTAAGWVGTSINGMIVCEVTVEYNGAWWDEQAIAYALSQVTLFGGPTEITSIASGGG